MSLDVDLRRTAQVSRICSECENEHTCTEVTWFYTANITHNLAKMAREAGIYDVVWEPEKNGITTASELIKPLEVGIALMKSNPQRFKEFDSPNGWGLYENFVPWLEGYLEACREYPDAEVVASR